MFLFLRDIAGGDLVQWIDDQLAGCAAEPQDDRLAAMRAGLIDPLRGIYGISDKIISMALSSLMIGAGARRPHWFEVGTSFVVVDSLVHNFLQRTGLLARFGASHSYGPGCYRQNGCAALIEAIAGQIDACAFNPAFPKVFPRFVQLSIWRYCSEGGLDICNGNRIDDRSRCANSHCQLHDRCDRLILRKTTEKRVVSAV